MIQSVCREPSGYASALECAMPLYLTLSFGEIEAIFAYVHTGSDGSAFPERYGERWIVATYKQLRCAEYLADMWLDADFGDLLSIDLDGLDDFALAVYATIVQDRDSDNRVSEGFASGYERANAAYHAIVKNKHGTDLLDYSWLYQDMLKYEMVADEEGLFQMHDIEIAHELCWGNSDSVVSALGSLACDWMTVGKIERGAALLSQIIENIDDCLDIVSHAAIVFHNLKAFYGCYLMLQKLKSMSNQNYRKRHFYEDLVLTLPRANKTIGVRTKWENRLESAVMIAVPYELRLTPEEIARANLPKIGEVAVKIMPFR